MEKKKEEFFMGWTEYQATYYKKGKIDRKVECDSLFTESCEVIKSSMVGNVYYAAIRSIKRYRRNENNDIIKDKNGKYITEQIPEKEQNVFAVVILTGTRNNYWFSYKNMDETCGPYYYDCPISILKLLTPTNDVNALEWRRKCMEKYEKKKDSIRKLPIGTKIKFTRHDGIEIVLTKHRPAYQFKKPFWVNESNWTYYKKKHIPENFEVLEYGE
jgi:hypothetical protein